MNAPARQPAYLFEGLRLDTQRRVLLGADGEPIALTARLFDTLVYFVERPGQLLTKEQLLEDLWPNVVVEEHNLNKAISELRRVLGEKPGEHRFIVTKPGRGYRFVAEVSIAAVPKVETSLERPSPGEPTAADSPWRSRKLRLFGSIGTESAPAEMVPSGSELVARPEVVLAPAATHSRRRAVFVTVATLVTLAVLAIGWSGHLRVTQPAEQQKGLAVLPFENLSPDSDNNFYALGIHDEVINQLNKISGLRVIPRTSVMPYLEHRKPISEIARELNVEAVVEGSVRYANERMRINLRVIDAATSENVWSNNYEFEFDDIFAIESDIALNVANALEATLAPQEVEALNEPPTRNPRAYNFYLGAKAYEERGVVEWPKAIDRYERAVEEDPGFALAYAELAMRRIGAHRWVDPDPALMDRAREAAQTALQLKPDLVEGWIALAQYQFFSGIGDTEQILRDLSAIESKAQQAPEFFGLRADIYEEVGRWEEALVDRTRLVELTPGNVPALLGNAHGYLVLRDYDHAERLFDQARDFEPDDPGMLVHWPSLYLYRDGDPAELMAFAPRMLSGELPPSSLVVTAALYARDHETARRLMELTPPATALGPDHDWNFARPSMIARIHQLAGRSELAEPLFETARDVIEKRLETAPPAKRLQLKLHLAAALTGLGEVDKGERAIREALEDLHVVPAGSASELHLMAAYASGRLGATELAVEQLDEYLSGPGVWSIDGLLRDPDFDLIRDDKRFLALVEKHTRH